MSRPSVAPGGIDLDALPLAAAAAASTGVASTFLPFFLGATLALHALTLAIWAGREFSFPAPAGPGWRRAAVGVAAGLGWAGFLGLSGPLAPLRGLLLGAAALPAGWNGRRRVELPGTEGDG